MGSHEVDTEYFKMIDRNIVRLMELGIEADLILFNPYDRWGFSNMPAEANELYLKYVTARFQHTEMYGGALQTSTICARAKQLRTGKTMRI